MYLLKEIEFIDYSDQDAIMINLINGATDLVSCEIATKIKNADFTNLDRKILTKLKARKYIFDSENDYQQFISNLDHKIEELEKSATPNFLVVPSYACNLRCIYCYEQTYMIKGTTEIDPLKMVYLQFTKIDFIMNAYIKKYGQPKEEIRITIMGGVNPF